MGHENEESILETIAAAVPPILAIVPTIIVVAAVAGPSPPMIIAPATSAPSALEEHLTPSQAGTSEYRGFTMIDPSAFAASRPLDHSGNYITPYYSSNGAGISSSFSDTTSTPLIVYNARLPMSASTFLIFIYHLRTFMF